LLVLDGNDVSRPALATVRLPFAVPMAFHGSWMARSGWIPFRSSPHRAL